jgi:glycosyltransferase involved in cell wall biosynthesis
MPEKKNLCNISGHRNHSFLNDEMQLVQTYSHFLSDYQEIHFISRSELHYTTISKHPDKNLFMHTVGFSNPLMRTFPGTVIGFYIYTYKLDKHKKFSGFLASDVTVGGLVCMFLNILNKKKYILEVQGEMTRISSKVVGIIRSKAFRYLTIITASRAERIRVVSRTIANNLAEDGVSKKKLSVVTSRVNLEKFDYKKYINSKAEVRKKYAVKSEDKLFVFVGRLVVFKGVNYLIEAFAKCKYHNYKLLIIGDGPLRSDLEKIATDLGIYERLIFIGAIPFEQVPYYLASADAFVMSSTDEGFPRVMLEAMSMKVPVISTLAGGVNDIARDGINGFYCPIMNSIILAETIDRYFVSCKLDSIVAEAYSMVINEYEQSIAIQKYKNLLVSTI